MWRAHLKDHAARANTCTRIEYVIWQRKNRIQRIVLEKLVFHLLHQLTATDSTSHREQHRKLTLHIMFVHLIKDELDEVQPLRRILFAFAPRLDIVVRHLLRHRVVRWVHQHDIKPDPISDKTGHFIEAAPLYNVRVTITMDQHVRRRKTINKLIILNTVDVALFDFILFSLRMTICESLRHRPNKKRAATTCHIEYYRLLIHVANLCHEVRDMVGRKSLVLIRFANILVERDKEQVE